MQRRGVLLVGPVPPPPGGVATHVRELARALEAREVPVAIVDPRHDAPDGDGRPRFVARLARAAVRGDLVHVHTNGHNRMSWVVAALGSGGHTLGRPCVLTLHSGLAPPFIRAHPRVVRAVCARYTAVVAVNAEIAAALASSGVPPARIAIAPAFSTASLAFRLSPPGLGAIRKRHPFLLASTVVHGAPEYGEDVLLDGFVRVRQRFDAAALIVYGPGTRSETFVAEVERRGLRGAVYCLGELERERALAVVAQSDLFVRPSRADGDAISVREALALGRPVVASNVGNRPPGTRLFAAGDAPSLAEKIFRVVGNPTSPADPSCACPVDGLPAVLAIYARAGVSFESSTLVTHGTPLATDVA
jgi:glycosyltransferase involved in cell wall biosynthesis